MPPGAHGEGPPDAGGKRPVPARRSVLVIDDDPMALRTLRRILKQHQVTAVTTGEAALELVALGERFDVVLTDVMMPGLSGVELYRRLARVAPDLVSRLVFITGGVACEKTRAVLDGLPNRWLAKPVNLTELRELVEGLAAEPAGA